MRKKNRRLKALGHELMSKVDFLVQEAVATGEEKGYRVRLPYRSVDRRSTADGEIVIDVSIYFDGEFNEESNEQGEVFKITGPHKARH